MLRRIAARLLTSPAAFLLGGLIDILAYAATALRARVTALRARATTLRARVRLARGGPGGR